MSDKKYWSSFAQLDEKSRLELQNRTKDEFAEELPFGDLDGKGMLDAKTPRRDFLKYLGFSTAAATLAASCEMPVRKAMPFVNRPENITPGVAKYYASTYVQDGDALPVVVKVRDGRPIKIEGNELYPFTQGGTSPRAQASVLDLYDMYRLTNPKRKSGAQFQEIPSFDQVDQQISAALAGVSGPVVLLTSTIVSPSTKQIIADFLGRYPGSRHVQYDAVSYSGMLLANESSQGRRALPAYNFEKAKAIISIGADFLGTWLSPVEFARQYANGRKINEANPTMSKHIQFESFLSMTGASADERYTHRPSETGAVVMALAAALGVAGVNAPATNAKWNTGIQAAVKAIQANRGQALVVSGSNDVNVQIIVNAINSAIGAYGSTIDSGMSINSRQGIDADMVGLVDQMNQGQVGALLIYGANPVYEYHDVERFKAGLAKVRLTVSFNEKLDETTELCQYSIPTHHYLESWGDAEPRTGYISFLQPTIFPLFKTRPFQTSLLKWSGNNTDYETYFRTFWTGRLGGLQAFDKALQDGLSIPGGVSSTRNNQVASQVPTPLQGQQPATTTDTITTAGTTERIVNTPQVSTGSVNVGGVGAAVAALSAKRASTGNEVVLYQNVAMLTGKQAGNPWLMELPDPITRATWDNYALISTTKAKELDINYTGTDFEYYQDRPTISLTVGNKTVENLPVMVVPGMDANTIAVAVGYGRSANFSKAIHEGKGVGKNVYQFARFNGTTFDYSNDVKTSDGTTGNHKVARIQMHDSYEGRTEVMKETTLATFMARPDDFKHWREELHKDYAPRTGDYRKEGTLYGDHVQPGLKWGMSIDLNSCIGCGACVVACHTENNVPVVGKNEVLRAHEMHWLRIDRYYVSAQENPDDLKSVIFQPMLCQHCDNAPCENVCPVAATMHSSEGINQMAYNRCIGTRYCANNCPYKVRRFNWADYTGSSTHGKLGPKSGVGATNAVVDQMNDELTRMVLNPDVVTRSRGVMEKCTFCIQRTQEGKLRAKMENRTLGPDEVQSACAQACPTSAIVFGNVNDSKGKVAQIRENNQRRNFYVLEQLHTLPNINYLAKIRNTDEVIPPKHKGAEGHANQQTGEPVTPAHEPAKH
ncbi:MAG: TAT-variant-translocated molybdopterin oxidoreductase [Flavisolibacter sp.]